MVKRLGGFGVSVAIAVGSLAAQQSQIIDKDQARALLVVALFLFVVSAAAVAWGWRRDRASRPSDDSDDSELFVAGPGSKIKLDDFVATGYRGPKLGKNVRLRIKRSRFDRHPSIPDDPHKSGVERDVRPEDEGRPVVVHEEADRVDDGSIPGADPKVESGNDDVA
jgi:hypothetical protein